MQCTGPVCLLLHRACAVSLEFRFTRFWMSMLNFDDTIVPPVEPTEEEATPVEEKLAGEESTEIPTKPVPQD